jgi:phage-related baseplate assembly protein
LESENPLSDSPGHISVVIISNNEESNFIPNQELIDKVKLDLEPRRLLTTRIHVVAPSYVTIGIQITLVLKSDALEKDVRPKVNEALYEFFHPLKGGSDGKGWEFGRSIYVSEIYKLLDSVQGVDYVEKEKTNNLDELTVQNESDRSRLQRNEKQQLVSVKLHPYELVKLQIDNSGIKIKTP